MKVAVTGGSGQLGSVVLRRLIDDRSVKRVISLDLHPPMLVSGKLEHVHADVRDPEIGAHFAGVDALIHLAFVVTQKMDHAEMEAINVGGSEHVFRAAIAAGCKRILYVSSIAAYGVYPDHPSPITEDCPRRAQPEFPYAAHKLAVEAVLDRLEAEHPELSVVRFRPSILYGLRMRTPLAKLAADLMRKGYLPNTGEAPMAVVWDEDVADAVHRALKRPGVKGAFNLSADDPQPSRALAQAAGLKLLSMPQPVLRALDHLSPVITWLGGGEAVDPSWKELREVAMVISSERARRELGWAPRCKTCVEVVQRFVAEVPGKPDRRISTALKLINYAARAGSKAQEEADAAQLRGIHADVHLCLTGQGGGDWALHADQAKISTRPGVPRPPTAVVTMKAALFLDMLAGRAEMSTAQLTGKLRIEGEPSAGFMIGGIIARLRALSRAQGVRGAPARALSRWLSRPVSGGAT